MRRQNLNQAQLADASGLTQGAISRLVRLDYGNMSINTCVRVAAGFDCGFVAMLVPFNELPDFMDRVSEKSVGIPSFDEVAAQAESIEKTQKAAKVAVKNLSGPQPVEQAPMYLAHSQALPEMPTQSNLFRPELVQSGDAELLNGFNARHAAVAQGSQEQPAA